MQVGVGKDVAVSLKVGSNLTEDAGRGEIEWENRDSGQDPLLDVGQVALPVGGTIGTFEELADCYRAGELGIARNGPDPIEIALKRTGP